MQEDDDNFPQAGEKQRLHRRDTPHHLKNKRINHQQVKEKSMSATKGRVLDQYRKSSRKLAYFAIR